MRFQVTQVMDTIERRLTTDVTWAQAVVDLDQVVRHVPLDGGREVNLVRAGLVVDALSRYLIDAGAMLYGVVTRDLLRESALTSKERMVLSRWVDDGLIEATSEPVAARVAEVADRTGLPLLAFTTYEHLADRYPWLTDGSGRVLRLICRAGAAALVPMDGTEVAATGPEVVTARVPVPRGEESGSAPGKPRSEKPKSGGPKSEKSNAAEGAATEDAAGEGATEAAGSEAGAVPIGHPMPLPVEVFLRGHARTARIRVARDRFVRASPNGAEPLLRRQWRCPEPECPAFGELRRIGQPVPGWRDGVAVCPRHGEPLRDEGPRPPSFAVSVVVDDLPRRRLVVRAEEPVRFGRGEEAPDLVSLAPWLHRAAQAWISEVHLRLAVEGDRLIATDLSTNGTLVWHRKGPDEPPVSRTLRRGSYQMGEWDSLELYTGIEVALGDHRPVPVLGRDEPASVLLDAPTAALPRIDAPDR